MATDTLLTISQVTNESLMVLENNLPFASQVSRKYDDSFAIEGAKIGDTINVRKPPRFIGTSGPNLNVEDYNQTSVPVIVGNPAFNGGTTNPYGDQFHVDTAFTTKDLRLSLGAFSDNVIKPSVAAIANRIDTIGLLLAKNAVGNIVGTPGTAPSTLLTYLTASAYMSSEGCPVDDGNRAIIVEPFTSASIVDSLKGLFTPSDKIAEQYRKGSMGKDTGGMNWKVGQNVALHSFGSWLGGVASTLTANTADAGILSAGWASTSTITLTQGATLTLNQGDVISIAGIYPVNPQNRKQYGSKTRTFTVQTTATGTGGGTFAVTVAPAIITAGQFQNSVVNTSSATAAVTPYSIGVSGVGVNSPQNIMFHKNAFTLAMVDMPLVEGVEFAGRASDKEAGLSIRVVRQYTVNNDQIPCRFDSLWGWAALYPELAIRVCS